MRSLSATLLASQKSMGDALVKIVLTKSGEVTQAYGVDTTNRILNLSHSEQEWSQVCQILVDNREGNLTALTLQGYTAIVSYGFHTGVARSDWVVDTVYALGTYVVPTTSNGYQYKCTTAGTSGSAGNEPTWETSLGGTTADAGTLVWTLDGNDGDEYSGAAPLEVISQKTDTLLSVGDLVTSFGCAGVFNMMGQDHASVKYSPASTNTDTVKTILTAIANKTMTGFTHCSSYTITFDSEDSLIDSYVPADYFQVGFNESRLSAFKRAISYTKCKARIEDDGAIHVFSPTISGDAWVASTAYVINDYVQPTTATNLFAYRCTTAGTSHSSEPTWPTTAGGTVTETGGLVWTAVAFDYEYTDAIAAANHNFFDKSVRKRLVIPTKEVVSSHPDHLPDADYTGSATDTASETALGRSLPSHHYIRATSSVQCTAIAVARLQHTQVGAEKGHGYAPMNCGQEVMDYVKITDSVASDLRIANVGSLTRQYRPGSFNFEFRFGSLEMTGLAGTMPPSMTGTTGAAGGTKLNELIANLNELRSAVIDIATTQNYILDYLLSREDTVPRWHVTQTLIIPVETNI